MDAREKLRQYLEQRRELGETELVLDTLGVDDVLKLLGAKQGERHPTSVSSGGARAALPSATKAAPAAPKVLPVPPAPSREPEAPLPGTATGDSVSFGADWRRALQEAGAAGDATSARPASRPPARPRAAPAGEFRASETPVVADGPAAEPDQFAALLASAGDTTALAAVIASCTRCPLYATAINPVPGEGNPAADMMIVGEAPGQDEDQSGRPFVGRSGQLLTKILAAIGFAREDVFIANVLKHRPPANRNPKPDEVVACSPYLLRQIELVKPRVILALGTFAAQTLLESKLPIGTLRGQVHHYHGVPLIVTYHPAALLRNPAWKRPTWEDVQLARRVLDSAVGGA